MRTRSFLGGRKRSGGPAEDINQPTNRSDRFRQSGGVWTLVHTYRAVPVVPRQPPGQLVDKADRQRLGGRLDATGVVVGGPSGGVDRGVVWTGGWCGQGWYGKADGVDRVVVWTASPSPPDGACGPLIGSKQPHTSSTLSHLIPHFPHSHRGPWLVAAGCVPPPPPAVVVAAVPPPLALACPPPLRRPSPVTAAVPPALPPLSYVLAVAGVPRTLGTPSP
jgi:hypothetical protein